MKETGLSLYIYDADDILDFYKYLIKKFCFEKFSVLFRKRIKIFYKTENEKHFNNSLK